MTVTYSTDEQVISEWPIAKNAFSMERESIRRERRTLTNQSFDEVSVR
jgi:hypothetical protein